MKSLYNKPFRAQVISQSPMEIGRKMIKAVKYHVHIPAQAVIQASEKGVDETHGEIFIGA